jgi:hypothetical protein
MIVIKRNLAELRRSLFVLKDIDQLGEFITEQEFKEVIHLYIKFSVNRPHILAIPDSDLLKPLEMVRWLKYEAIWNALCSGMKFTEIAARMNVSNSRVSQMYEFYGRRLMRQRANLDDPLVCNEVMALAYAIAVN